MISAALAIAADAYSIRCMTELYEVEIEPEVRSWLASLSDRDFGRVPLCQTQVRHQGQTATGGT